MVFGHLSRLQRAGHGRPETVYAAASSRQPGHPERRDNFSAIVRFTGGAYAVVSQTLSAFNPHRKADRGAV